MKQHFSPNPEGALEHPVRVIGRSQLAHLGQAALKRQVDQGQHRGPVPLGYRRCVMDGVVGIELDPETAPMIQELFRLRISGSSVRAIQRTAHSRGLRSKRGGRLSVSAIQHILTCSTYRGLIQLPDGSVVRGQHEAIVQDQNQSSAVPSVTPN